MKVYLNNIKNYTSLRTGTSFLSGEFAKFRNNEFAKNAKVSFYIYKPELVESVFNRWSVNNEAVFDFDMETIEFTWRSFESKKHPGVTMWNLVIIFNDLTKDNPKKELDDDVWSELEYGKE